MKVYLQFWSLVGPEWAEKAAFTRAEPLPDDSTIEQIGNVRTQPLGWNRSEAGRWADKGHRCLLKSVDFRVKC